MKQTKLLILPHCSLGMLSLGITSGIWNKQWSGLLCYMQLLVSSFLTLCWTSSEI